MQTRALGSMRDRAMAGESRPHHLSQIASCRICTWRMGWLRFERYGRDAFEHQRQHAVRPPTRMHSRRRNSNAFIPQRRFPELPSLVCLYKMTMAQVLGPCRLLGLYRQVPRPRALLRPHHGRGGAHGRRRPSPSRFRPPFRLPSSVYSVLCGRVSE